MKLHRFYVGDSLELDRKVWVNDQDLLHQWTRVLRFRPDQEIILFNNLKEERLYKIDRIEPKAVHLSLITEMDAKTPKSEIYLCFSLLKKDKNDWVLQKATELGVRHFVPLISDRTEKTGFDVERATKIVIEAAEQCGRSDIPNVREPIALETAIEELNDKADIYVAEQGSKVETRDMIIEEDKDSIGVFIGPEGGWSDAEKQLFQDNKLEHLPLSEFTLRAETAAILAVAVMQKQ